jgi:hypothetical protein
MCNAHPLADITEPGHDSDLAGKHDVGGTLDTVDERLAATVVLYTRLRDETRPKGLSK